MYPEDGNAQMGGDKPIKPRQLCGKAILNALLPAPLPVRSGGISAWAGIWIVAQVPLRPACGIWIVAQCLCAQPVPWALQVRMPEGNTSFDPPDLHLVSSPPPARAPLLCGTLARPPSEALSGAGGLCRATEPCPDREQHRIQVPFTFCHGTMPRSGTA